MTVQIVAKSQPTVKLHPRPQLTAMNNVNSDVSEHYRREKNSGLDQTAGKSTEDWSNINWQFLVRQRAGKKVLNHTE